MIIAAVKNKIALGSDHRGVDLRRIVANYLEAEGYEVDEYGASDLGTTDYPDIAATIAKKVSTGEVKEGILICGTGIGMCVVANKFPGVRATPCTNDVAAELSRKHNNSNVLCLSGDMLGKSACVTLVDKWLRTDFEGGRHKLRLDKIDEIERKLHCN